MKLKIKVETVVELKVLTNYSSGLIDAEQHYTVAPKVCYKLAVNKFPYIRVMQNVWINPLKSLLWHYTLYLHFHLASFFELMSGNT